jgi:hypothetical protein
MRPPIQKPRITMANNECPGSSSTDTENQLWNLIRNSLKYTDNTMVAAMTEANEYKSF